MQRHIALLLALAPLAALPPAPAYAANVPTKIGQCVETSIKEKGTRLEGVSDSGSLVVYQNDIVGVSYDTIKAITRARVGDKITLCLTSLPEDCPPGDDRGKSYSALDHRTKGKWELYDAEHLCGGA